MGFDLGVFGHGRNGPDEAFVFCGFIKQMGSRKDDNFLERRKLL